MLLKPCTIDFETEGIQDRPQYPPKPVGVAIKYWGRKAKYYSWGHPTKNNCTKAEATKALRSAWQTPAGVLFHNAKFDVDVAEVHMKMRRLNWARYHDTLYLLFLDDPHQKLLGLKPSSERLLDMPPEEQDIVANWLIKNQPVPEVKISTSFQSEHYFAKYTSLAPGSLVGKYAIGDVDRTEKLFNLLMDKTVDRGMQAAYDRERRLMPILLEVERQGVRVDAKRLKRDVGAYQKWHDTLTQWAIKRIKAPADINLNSGVQLVKALIKCDKVDLDQLGVTPNTGRPKSDKESLAAAVTDKQLLAVLKYRTQLRTCLHTFMEPWLKTARKSKGLIFTMWNQTRTQRGSGNVGTRTGRLSSTPNFQNIPKGFAEIFANKGAKKGLPRLPIPRLPALPLVRGYIIPSAKNHVLLDRDYSQQELRILAHFEDGVLADAYAQDPWMDIHEYATNLINKMTGKKFERKAIKTTGFGLIYGMGVGLLAVQSGITVEMAKEVKEAYLATFPGLKEMNQDMRFRAQSKLPIRTWGGREYYCEPPVFLPNGRMITLEYKMMNVLIQGSAADCTKEAIIRFHDAALKAKVPVNILINVHDQITISCARKVAKKAMQILRQTMESIEFDVPMLSEGKWSSRNWAVLKDYDKGGKTRARI